jgi:hypothetical protein
MKQFMKILMEVLQVFSKCSKNINMKIKIWDWSEDTFFSLAAKVEGHAGSTWGASRGGMRPKIISGGLVYTLRLWVTGAGQPSHRVACVGERLGGCVYARRSPDPNNEWEAWWLRGRNVDDMDVNGFLQCPRAWMEIVGRRGVGFSRSVASSIGWSTIAEHTMA